MCFAAFGRNPSRSFFEQAIGHNIYVNVLTLIDAGGVVDSSHQSLVLQLMILGPEDVCKVCGSSFRLLQS
jgi:hypothetical protein